MSDEKDDSDIVFFAHRTGTKDLEHNHHLEHPEVQKWLDPGDIGFKPTKQQELFRDLAYKMARRGKFFRGEWFESTKQKGYKGARINERVWLRWCGESDQFKMWFYEEFPETKEMSEEEFAMMDSQYWTGVRDAMSEGEEWAYRQYSKTRFDSAAAKKDQADSESLTELRSYFDTGNGDAWSVKPGEA
jgi:hypothetical protein